jgi:hypothetical protein
MELVVGCSLCEVKITPYDCLLHLSIAEYLLVFDENLCWRLPLMLSNKTSILALLAYWDWHFF